jgi:hypothetical protein
MPFHVLVEAYSVAYIKVPYNSGKLKILGTMDSIRIQRHYSRGVIDKNGYISFTGAFAHREQLSRPLEYHVGQREGHGLHIGIPWRDRASLRRVFCYIIPADRIAFIVHDHITFILAPIIMTAASSAEMITAPI